MRHLYIIGARGYGREVYNLFCKCEQALGDVKCIGFLDDKKDALNGFAGYPPVVSSVEAFAPQDNDVFICALGDPKWIRHYTKIMEDKGGKFISLVSPNAFIGRNTTIGYGCIINDWASVSCDISIGNHVSIGSFSDLGHDSKVGNCCHLGSYTFMGGGSMVGDGVTAHPRVNILPHKSVGDNATLGAGSVVIRNVKANTTVFGVPAKKIN